MGLSKQNINELVNDVSTLFLLKRHYYHLKDAAILDNKWLSHFSHFKCPSCIRSFMVEICFVK